MSDESMGCVLGQDDESGRKEWALDKFYLEQSVHMGLFSIYFDHGIEFLIYKNIGFNIKLAWNEFLQLLEFRKQVCEL